MLVISNVIEGDGGFYCCIVESGGLLKYSDEVELKVFLDIEVILDLVFLK